MSGGWHDPDEPDQKRGRLGKAWHRSCALRGCTWAFVVLGLPWIALWGWLDWSSQRAVQSEMDWLRDHGFYLSADDIPERHIPDEQNAALVYEEALGPQAFVNSYPPTSRLDPTGRSLAVVMHFLRDGTGRAHVEAMMADPVIIGILDELERGSRMPECALPGEDLERCPAAKPLRNASHWLWARTRLCAESGSPDEALRWIIATLRISEHIGEGTGWQQYHLSSTVRGMALLELVRALSTNTPSPQRLTDLQDTLAGIDPEEDFDAFIRVMPVSAIQSMEKFSADPMAAMLAMGFERSDLPAGYWFGAWLRPYRVARPLHNSDVMWHLRPIREAHGASRTVPARPIPRVTPSARPRAMDQLAASIAADVPLTYRSFLGLHGSFVPLYPEQRDHDLARLRLAQVAVAVTLYEAERGVWPATLDEVASASGQALPSDPYTGKPLDYQRRERGFILRSDGPRGGGAVGLTWECAR